MGKEQIYQSFGARQCRAPTIYRAIASDSPSSNSRRNNEIKAV
ncbi:MAG: hypothetical protein KA716_32865 [Gloeotrichia echinulata DEX184]